MSDRIKDAFRAAAAPTAAMLILCVLIFLVRWSSIAANPKAALAVGCGLVLVVFLTYFVLALTGFKASPEGVVGAPRVYTWPLLFAIVVAVFGALFYFLYFR